MAEPTKKIYIISSLLMAFLFAYSASVQLNDPDWYFWFPLYTVASVVNIFNSISHTKSEIIRKLSKLGFWVGLFLFLKVLIEDYVHELAGFGSMDLSKRIVREKTGSGLVVISMFLQLIANSSYQSQKGNRMKVTPRYVDYGMGMLVSVSYGIPLVFFVFLKGEIGDTRK